MQHKTKGFSRSLADRQPTSSILRIHARSEIEMNLSLFAKIEKSMEIFFLDFSWQLTVVTDMAGVAQLPRN